MSALPTALVLLVAVAGGIATVRGTTERRPALLRAGLGGLAFAFATAVAGRAPDQGLAIALGGLPLAMLGAVMLTTLNVRLAVAVAWAALALAGAAAVGSVVP